VGIDAALELARFARLGRISCESSLPFIVASFPESGKV